MIRRTIRFLLSVMVLSVMVTTAVATPSKAHAAALSNTQVQAILNLLVSFGADQSTVNKVTEALGGGTIPSETVDIKAAGFDGPITIQKNTIVSLSWKTSGMMSCVLLDSFSGKSENIEKGIQSGFLDIRVTNSSIYSLSCQTGTIGGRTVVDKVIVNVTQGVAFGPTCTYIQNSSMRTSNDISVNANTTADQCKALCTTVRNEKFGQSDAGACIFANAQGVLQTMSILPAASDTVTVTAPNGNEVITTGTTYNIKWNPVGASTDIVKVNLYATHTDTKYPGGTVFQETLAPDGALNTGSFQWKVSEKYGLGWVPNKFYVEIVSTKKGATDRSDAPFTIKLGNTHPTLTFSSPTAGAQYKKGDVVTIRWSPLPYNQSYGLVLLKEGDPSFVSFLSTSLSYGKDEWKWTIPSDFPEGNYYFRAEHDTNALPVSFGYSNVFKVSGAATTAGITLTAPNGGEKWELGVTNSVTWAPYQYNPDINPSADVSAYLEKKNSNGSFTTLGRVEESGKASIHWITGDLNSQNGAFSQVPEGQYYIRVVNNKTGAEDRSDNAFTITARPVNVRVNGSAGPVSLSDNQKITVTWSSTGGRTVCDLSGVREIPNGNNYVGNLPASGTRTFFAAVYSQWDSNTIAAYCRIGNDYSTSVYATVAVNAAAGTSAKVQILSPNGGEKIDPSKQMDILYAHVGLKTFSAALYKNDQWKAWIVKDQPIPGPTQSSISFSPSSLLQGLGEGDNTGAIFKVYITGIKADGSGYVDDKSDAPFSFVKANSNEPKDWVGGCANPPVIVGPDAYVGKAYTFDPKISNAGAPYPALPSGLTKSNGIITGTPVTAGAVSVKVFATNSCGAAVLKFNIISTATQPLCGLFRGGTSTSVNMIASPNPASSVANTDAACIAYCDLSGTKVGDTCMRGSSIIKKYEAVVVPPLSKGALTISVAASPASQIIIAGSAGYTFAFINLDASSSGEDVSVSSMPFALGSSANKYIGVSNCQLFSTSETSTNASALTTGRNVVSPTISANTFTFDTPVVIAKGTVKTLSLRCNISVSATGAYKWGIVDKIGTVVRGVTTKSEVTETVITNPGNEMTVVSGGVLSVSTDASTPSYREVSGEQKGLIVGVYKFNATNESIRLTRVGLKLTSGSSGDLSAVRLYAGSTYLGEAVFVGTNKTAIVTLNSPLVINRDTNTAVTVRADINGVGVNSPATLGSLIQIDADTTGTNTSGTGSSSGVTIAAVGSTKVAGVRIVGPTTPATSSDVISTVAATSMAGAGAAFVRDTASGAWMFSENTASSTHQINNYLTLPDGYTTADTWTLSFLAQPKGRSKVVAYILNTNNQGGEYGAMECALTGVEKTSSWKTATATNLASKVTPQGDGWYRCLLQVTPSVVGSKNMRVSLQLVANGNVYQGDGSSGILVKDLVLTYADGAKTLHLTKVASRDTIRPSDLIAAVATASFEGLVNSLANLFVSIGLVK